MKEPVFTGVATAMVTPFSSGIDYLAFDRLLERQIEADINAVVVTGTTGEASTLRSEERAALWARAAKVTRGRCTVIAGIGTNCTQTSIEQARLAQRCGADALLAVTPYYNKCNQQGLIAHYRAIADATDLPLILYNVPSRTGVHLLPETCRELASHPRINGIKEASGSISQVARILAVCPKDFYVWSGNDDQITATCAIGGKGVISVLSNLRPEATLAMCGAGRDAAGIQVRYMPLIDALFSDVNPIPIKTALALEGLCHGTLRLPLSPLDEEKTIKLKKTMAQCP